MDRSDSIGMINRTRTNSYYVRKIAFVSTKCQLAYTKNILWTLPENTLSSRFWLNFL